MTANLAPEPMFVTVPPRPQRVLHSGAYIKYRINFFFDFCRNDKLSKLTLTDILKDSKIIVLILHHGIKP